MTGICRAFLVLGLIMQLSACTTAASKEKMRESARNKRVVGEANILQGNYTGALKILMEAKALNPDDFLIYHNLGIVYKEKKMLEQSILNFKKALELNPRYSQSMNNLGAAYLDAKQWDKAIDCFRNVLDDILYATPQYPLANIGYAYFHKKEYRLAEVYFQKALEKQPNMLVALNGLGQTYIAQKNYPKAVSTYEKTVKFGGQYAYWHFQLAKAYELEHAYDKAMASYRSVINIMPDNEMADDAQAAIDRIRSFYKP